MAENMMFRTKDNHIVVMNLSSSGVSFEAEKRRIAAIVSGQTYYDCRHNFSALGLPLDTVNTDFVEKYVHKFDYRRRKEDFVNAFADPAENSMLFNRCFAPCLKGLNYDVKTADIPLDVQALGFKIIPEDVQYTIGDDGKIVEDFDNTRASVYIGERKILVYRNHFNMSDENRRLMDSLIAEFEDEKKNKGTDAAEFEGKFPKGSKERNLFAIYRAELENIQQQRLILHHEFKHIKDYIHIYTKLINESQYRLSAEDNLLLAAEMELQAFTSMTINGRNEYLKQGDLNNFEMFSPTEDAWLVEKLKALPESERKNFLTPENIINEARKHFLTEKLPKSNYPKQFEDCAILNFVNQTAMSLPEDTGPMSHTFLRIRKQMSYFPFYDESSKKYKMVNTAKYIDDADTWTPEADVTSRVKSAIDGRKKAYDDAVKAGANPALIEEARKFMRKRGKAAVVSADNTYIESLDADWIARHGIADDRAGWSDYLQEYYKRQNGYVELAKNNDEYAFKLGQDTVRYTDPKNVAIDKESNFDTYMKVVNAPTARGSIINFRPNLDEEQKLMLFAACVASGRKMKGEVPTDLSGLDRLQGIDDATMARINRVLGRTPGSSATTFNSGPTRTQTTTRSTGRSGCGSRRFIKIKI